MNHLNQFGVCELAGCTNIIILQNYFKKNILIAFLGVQI